MNQPDRQRTWTGAETQSQLSEILRLAESEGPQHIGILVALVLDDAVGVAALQAKAASVGWSRASPYQPGPQYHQRRAQPEC